MADSNHEATQAVAAFFHLARSLKKRSPHQWMADQMVARLAAAAEERSRERHVAPLTIGEAKARPMALLAECGACHEQRLVDLDRLIAIKGPDYSLVNRRCRCRITAGCAGWVVFKRPSRQGWQPLYDSAAERRWARNDPADRHDP